jgi:hypothetical protein
MSEMKFELDVKSQRRDVRIGLRQNDELRDSLAKSKLIFA